MSEGTLKELMAVVEVVHAYFQKLYKERKNNIQVSGKIQTTGPAFIKERAIELAVTIRPGNLYKADEVSSGWIAGDVSDPNSAAAQKQKKQLHPDTVYAALCILIGKKKIRDGGLVYTQLRSKENSTKTGQPRESASANPKYILPDANFKEKMFATSLENSPWYGKNMIGAPTDVMVFMEQSEIMGKTMYSWRVVDISTDVIVKSGHSIGSESEAKEALQKWLNANPDKQAKFPSDNWNIEQPEVKNEGYALISSSWYKTAMRKNVSSLDKWLAANILPPYAIEKINQLKTKSKDIDWKWIPSVSKALLEIK